MIMNVSYANAQHWSGPAFSIDHFFTIAGGLRPPGPGPRSGPARGESDTYPMNDFFLRPVR